MYHLPLISIIVPVFNVETYLDECLSSVLGQSYRNLEIILIDDGSTDSSGNICDRYARQDARVIVVHKQNGGLSSARNAGIEKARGEYLSFIDSDDLIEPPMIETLYRNIKTNGVDVAACAISQFKDGGCQKEIWNSVDKDQVLTSDRYLELIFTKKVDNAVWNKIFRKELLENLRFEEGKINEDILFIFELLKVKPSLHYSSYPLYNYRIREKSITQNISNKTFDFVKNAFFIRKEIQGSSNTLKWQVDNYLLYEIVSYISIFLKSGSPAEHIENVRICRRFFNTNILRLLSNSYIPIYLKTKALLCVYVPWGFKFLVRLKSK